MSATFKIAKKKYTQSDLRKLLNEHKSKVRQSNSQEKVDSPLAKYNDLGQLTCILCKSVVRSESVWKVHINSKQHKENVTAAKQLREQLQAAQQCQYAFKRPAEKVDSAADVPEKRTKGTDIIKQSIPVDFFDSKSNGSYFRVTLEKTSIKADLINIKRDSEVDAIKNDGSHQSMEVNDAKDEKLPEGFFDDPVKDAKIRNQEYKDPQDEEWERFQREIKEETTLSSAIIAEEQDEATAERQIEEIDEQIRKWSRVLDLEKRKENVATLFKSRSSNRMKADDSESDTNDDHEDNSDEFFDWRAKRSDRKV